jgi:hypothetical protein
MTPGVIEERCFPSIAVQIKLPKVAGKASFLFHALEFLISSISNDTYVAKPLYY